MESSPALESRIESVFHEVFGRSDFQLNPNLTSFDIEGWDSLTHVRLIVMIEKEFAIKFKTSEILSLRNVGDLFRLVRSKVPN